MLQLAPHGDPWTTHGDRCPVHGAERDLRGPVDEVVLALFAAHEVLASSQVVRLTGLPERTVQHRLGLLGRAGLLKPDPPPRAVGTSSYH
ncbi:MAG: hypothetical protein M0008_07425 [Actinomycetota bacterium]|nr:hypothetical protein [Actinomycetota bacterium]